MRVLEIGTGTNYATFPIEGKDIFHIDIAREAHNINLVCDAHKIPFNKNSFDVVYCAHVLEHCYNPMQVLKEIYRVTRKIAIIKTPNLDYAKHTFDDKEHLYNWTPTTLRQLMLTVFDHAETWESNIIRTNTKNKLKKALTFNIAILLKALWGKNEVVAKGYKL